MRYRTGGRQLTDVLLREHSRPRREMQRSCDWMGRRPLLQRRSVAKTGGLVRKK